MNKKRLFLMVSAIFIVLLMTGCKVVVVDDDCDDDNRGTVIVKNNTSEHFKGSVWTESRTFFDNDTIHAGQSKTFHVHKNSTVYIDFESKDGSRKIQDSDYVKKGRTITFKL